MQNESGLGKSAFYLQKGEHYDIKRLFCGT